MKREQPMRLAVAGLVTAGLCLALLCDGALAQQGPTRRPEIVQPNTPRDSGNSSLGSGLGGSQPSDTPQVTALRAARDKTNEELSKCLVEQTVSMIRSTERAEIVAESALVLCAAAVRKHAESVMALLRAVHGARAASITPRQVEADVLKGRRVILIALIVKARTAPAGKGTVTPASIPAGDPPTHLKRTRACLDNAGRGTMKVFVSDDAKMMAVLDVCRAEIEAYARADFAAKGSPTLEEARTKAFLLAKEHAKKAITP